MPFLRSSLPCSESETASGNVLDKRNDVLQTQSNLWIHAHRLTVNIRRLFQALLTYTAQDLFRSL